MDLCRHEDRFTFTLHRTASDYQSLMTATPSPIPNTSTSALLSSRGAATVLLACLSILLQVGSAFTASAASENQIFLKGPQYYGVGPMNKDVEFLQGGTLVNPDPESPKMLLVGYGGGPLVIYRAILCFDLQDFAKELKAANSPHRSVGPTGKETCDLQDRGLGRGRSGQSSWPSILKKRRSKFKCVASILDRKSLILRYQQKPITLSTGH